MLINGWAVALTISSIIILFFGMRAVVSSVTIVRYWNHEADTARQLRLENEQLLVSSLLEHSLVFQACSLLLLVLAADSFSGILVGAMCATGAFTANSYGIYTVPVKIVSVFLAGYWLLLHRLDMRSVYYPLVIVKYGYILLLVPILLIDFWLQSAYLFNLDPDVITSCCGVLFRPERGDGFNLLDPVATPALIIVFYGLGFGLLLTGLYTAGRLYRGAKGQGASCIYFFAFGWAAFLVIALWSVTVVFSPYIYAMPSHRCPFDIIQHEYGYIGYPIYVSLLVAAFLGTGCGVAQAVRRKKGLAEPVLYFQMRAVIISLVLLVCFLVLTGFFPLRYFLMGGEV